MQGAPFVSAPARSTALSSSADEGKIGAVCSHGDCSATLNADGTLKAHVGRCRALEAQLVECRRHARERGLLEE